MVCLLVSSSGVAIGVGVTEATIGLRANPNTNAGRGQLFRILQGPMLCSFRA